MAKKKYRSSVLNGDAPAIILTNERTQFKANQLLLFYQAAELGQLGYMDGMDPETGEIVPLLVGIEPVKGTEQIKVMPLARLISKMGDIKPYLVPDGAGNYRDFSIKESLPIITDDGRDNLINLEEEAGTSD